MADTVNEYLNSLQLGDVQSTDSVKLSDDAKMLIFLNPGMINQLAAEVQDLSRPAIFVVYDRNLVKVRSTKMNYDAIRPDDPAVAVEHQATGEQPVHVTPDGVQAGDLTGAPVSLRCPVCGGKLSDVRRQGGRYLTHCYSCHFEFYLEGEE